MKKQFFLWALLLFCTLPTFADDFEVDGIYYDILGGDSVAVTYGSYSSYYGYNHDDEYSGSVTIPETVEYNSTTYRVTEIDYSAFRDCSGLTSVTIPNSVTTIGDYAFDGCSGLTSVTIPNSVTTIGEYAFRGCSGLTSVMIPNSVTTIDRSAFSNCSGLTSVTIPESVTTIGDGAFSGCSGLTSVTIPNSVTTIGYYAFSGCSGLTSVTIPESVTEIGSSAFRNCSGLTSVIWNAKHCQDFTSFDTPFYYDGYYSSDNFDLRSQITSFIFGDSVQHIPAYLCDGMTNLTSVTIPESVTTIGDYAFDGCSGLTKTNYTGDIASWCAIDFYSSTSNPIKYSHNLYINDVEVKDLVIPEGVTTIGYYAFSGCSGLTSVTIPESVTTIGSSAFSGCSGLIVPVYNAHVFAFLPTNYSGAYTIPDGITSIAGAAFYACSGLTSVTIPNSVTEIGSSAFYACSGLTSVTIPNSVTEIGSSAFSGCSGLTSVTIPNSVTTIGIYAFNGCSGLTSVTIGNSVTTIGFGAFEDCSGLTSVTIGESVTEIGNKAFYGCSGLTSVIWNAKHCQDFTEDDTPFYYYYSYNSSYNYNLRNQITSFIFGDSVQHIPAYLCSGMKNLTSVTIGNSVTTIGDYAFRGCSGLTSVIWNAKHCQDFTEDDTPFYYYYSYNSSYNYNLRNQITSFTFGDSVEYIPAYLCYGMKNLTNVSILNENVEIGNYAFGDCPNIPVNRFDNAKYMAAGTNKYHTLVSAKENTITSCYIHPNTRQISDSAFYKCFQLTSITIPESVTTIGSYAFYYCSKLTSIMIPESVTTIGSSAFEHCSGLTSVTIPNSITTIGSEAFSGCSSLTSVTIPESVTTIGSSAFYGCSSLTSVTIPESVTTIGSSAFYGCYGLTKTNYTGDIASWCAIDFDSYSSNPIEYSHNLYINDVEVKDLVIPEGVDTINAYAFSGCSGLTSVKIPNSVIEISDYAFYGCDGLTSVMIPNSVTTIGSYAFYYCSGLTSVMIPNSVIEISDYAFCGCSGLTSVTIPNSVTEIHYAAFGNTKLRYLVLPNSVTSIGNSAFANCTNISAIKVEATEPPTYTYNTFDGLSKETPIFVPCGSLDTYTASSWANYFANFVESEVFFLAQSEDEKKGEVVVMLNPTCDDPMAMMRVVPKDGYKFVAWNDGNTETMRTIEAVTEDVIYTARFAALDGSDEVKPEDIVQVESTATTAGFTWQPEEAAYYYSLFVFTDAEMTDTVCKMTFDAAGNMLTKEWVEPQSAPRRKAQSTVSALNFVVTELTSSTTYTYMLRSYDCNNMILETTTGTFTTAEEPVSNVSIISGDTDSVRKVFENGTIYILKPNGEKYTIDGRRIM